MGTTQIDSILTSNTHSEVGYTPQMMKKMITLYVSPSLVKTAIALAVRENLAFEQLLEKALDYYLSQETPFNENGPLSIYELAKTGGEMYDDKSQSKKR